MNSSVDAPADVLKSHMRALTICPERRTLSLGKLSMGD